MEELVEKKTKEASKVSKVEVVNQIKSESPKRFDQMLIESEIFRNDIFYINFKSSYVNLKAKKTAFAMLPQVKNHFNNNCCGGGSKYGKVSVVEKSFIKSISDSKCKIVEKEYVGIPNPGEYKSEVPYQFIKKGFAEWQNPNIKSEADLSEKKGSLLGNIKKATGSISSAVKSIDDKIDSVGDKVNNSLKWFNSKGQSESEEYASLKANYFNHLQFKYNDSKISEIQPTYFIPDLTHSETCGDCKGNGEIECPTCGGKGKLKCKGYVGSGSGGVASNAVYSCRNGIADCDSCDGSGYDKDGSRCRKRCKKGKLTCPTCNGAGEVNCERKYASSYGIGKLADAATGKEFCKGSGKIICDSCKATGEIGKIVYVEIEVGNTFGEFYKYTNEIIEKIQKKPDTLFNYLDKSSVKPQIVYTDINGVLNEKYDSNSDEFCQKVESFSGLMKGNEYPRVVSEEIFYDVIPISTLEYNHILSGTKHKVSSIYHSSSPDIFFHTDPTHVNKFSFGSIFKAFGWNIKKAFATKSYKEKLDKKHELFLLVRVAKADGLIEESEKRILVDVISNLNEFSNKEKAKLFNLFSIKVLPKLTEEETVFSNKERAEQVIQNLNKMMSEDGDIETPEVTLIKSLKEKIHSNIGKHPKFASSFFKTWQVSIPIILSLFSIIGFVIYLSFFSDKTKLNNVYSDNSNFKTDYSEVAIAIDENPIINEQPIALDSNDKIVTSEGIVTAGGGIVKNVGNESSKSLVEEDLSSLLDVNYAIGEWKGAFGNKQLLINIESINEDGSVFGFNIVKNNRRNLTGFKVGNKFELKEPGDDKWDGVFSFTIDSTIASGKWTANNGKSTKKFVLRK